MQAGRDVTTNLTINNGPSGSNAGRVHAVTTSVEAMPIGEKFWRVKVNNGTQGPITNLAVDVYSVDDEGNRTQDVCVPAKQRMPLDQLMREILGPAMLGGLGAITDHAALSGFPIPAQSLAAVNMFGGLPINAMLAAAKPKLQAEIAAHMAENFPEVIPAGESGEVAYWVEADVQVQADIQFDDEEGTRWSRPFGQPPRRVE
ncbi:hypothetical protein AB0I35_32210 [Nocardia sp. NPDC050378]|uniref:hypothetical protein n=1 Tax=Nocardia sp. NPDC050378 TaxID=3155400 RepID=UPI0033CD4AB8